MSYSNIETKAEQAFVGYLNLIASRIAGVTIHEGVDPAELPCPNVVANATGAEEHIKGTGNYVVDIQVEIHSIADDTTAAVHRARVAAVRDELSADWIGTSINAANSGSFTIAGSSDNWGIIHGKSTQEIQDERWVTVIPLLVHCWPS